MFQHVWKGNRTLSDNSMLSKEKVLYKEGDNINRCFLENFSLVTKEEMDLWRLQIVSISNAFANSYCGKSACKNRPFPISALSGFLHRLISDEFYVNYITYFTSHMVHIWQWYVCVLLYSFPTPPSKKSRCHQQNMTTQGHVRTPKQANPRLYFLLFPDKIIILETALKQSNVLKYRLPMNILARTGY